MFGGDAVQFYRHFGEGLIARMTNDQAKARAAFTAARAEQEKRVQAKPEYGPALCALAVIDAGLGRKEDALRENRRAIELVPVEKVPSMARTWWNTSPSPRHGSEKKIWRASNSPELRNYTVARSATAA